MTDARAFIDEWARTGGSELANTQSFVNGLCALIGVAPPAGSRVDDAANDYVFERRVFQREADGTESFGRIDAYKRGCFVLEAKQGSDADHRAVDRGDPDLDLFGQSASTRVKRGTARRGTPAWAQAMVAARGQAERYAKAVPLDHGWPPFLLVTDIGHCIDVYADFSRTGKAYTQFPDAARYRIMLDDLDDPDVRARLAGIWTDPLALDPAREAARVTREVADRLAILSKRLEARHPDATVVADFLMRCLFTMFAQGTGLLPERGFTALLTRLRDSPEHLPLALGGLWAVMDAGGWRLVEPAIFGTLLERALSAKERAALGAHYTPRAYVERLVLPTVIEPLRAEWAGVRAAYAQLIAAGRVDDARLAVEAFHGRLSGTRVLDPACGTGNFLYVTMALMKELEGEVLALLRELGDDRYIDGLGLATVRVENFLGIEVNPRAAAIAQLVLWIGALQWHFRVNGAGRLPPEPVLRDVKTIECRDALMSWKDRVLVRDAGGKPLSRWDGETTTVHPVTGRKVPDETARVEVWRYVVPSAAKWPRADYIVGNPPFIGGKDIRDRLGGDYADALFQTTDVPESADFVMHWWDKAAVEVAKKRARRFGFNTTNSLPQTFSRRVVARHLDGRDRLSLVLAIPNHPWVDERDGAAVRIAMTVAERGRHEGQLLTVVDESAAPERIEFASRWGPINSDLRIGADVTAAAALKANDRIASPGVKLHGDGFIVTPQQATALGWPDDADARIRTGVGDEREVIFAYRHGRDLAARPRGKLVIDLFGLTEAEVRDRYPAVYQHVLLNVRPARDGQAEKSPTADARAYAQTWWQFGKPRPLLRAALAGVDRYIATIETAKHRVFQFLPTTTVPDNMLVCIATRDALHLAVLSSRAHVVWALAAGGRLGVGDDPRYTKSRCFDPFPFPADVPPALADRLRAEAEALDALRKRVLAEQPDLTLTGLYNVREALRAGRALTDAERDVHDRGLVTLIANHHHAIDAAVAQAYGWPADLSDAEILTRLVALNGRRAGEEARGLVRWLRPAYQNPVAQDYAKGIEDLGLGDAPTAATATILPWPTTLPAQISAVAGLLASQPLPQDARAIARAFQGKRAASVTPVLDALTAIGQARRLSDGRYAA